MAVPAASGAAIFFFRLPNPPFLYSDDSVAIMQVDTASKATPETIMARLPIILRSYARPGFT